MTKNDGFTLREALARLRDGRCFYHRGVNLWLAPDGYLEVRVHTDWRVEETDEQRSLDDLGFARRDVAMPSRYAKCQIQSSENTPSTPFGE